MIQTKWAPKKSFSGFIMGWKGVGRRDSGKTKKGKKGTFPRQEKDQHRRLR